MALTNSKRKAGIRIAAKLARTAKPRRNKHALFQGDPNTPGKALFREASENMPERRVKVTDPRATPASITNELATLHATGGNHSRRNGLEQRYFAFHKAQGVRVRGKYRPQ